MARQLQQCVPRPSGNNQTSSGHMFPSAQSASGKEGWGTVISAYSRQNKTYTLMSCTAQLQSFLQTVGFSIESQLVIKIL